MNSATNRTTWINLSHTHLNLNHVFRSKKQLCSMLSKRKQKIFLCFYLIIGTHIEVWKKMFHGNTFLSSSKLPQVSLWLDVSRKHHSVFQKRGAFQGHFKWMNLIIQYKCMLPVATISSPVLFQCDTESEGERVSWIPLTTFLETSFMDRKKTWFCTFSLEYLAECFINLKSHLLF